MKRVKKLDVAPPGGWRYQQNQSGLLVKALTWRDLYSRVLNHRVANGYPVEPNLADVLQDEMCQQWGWGKEHCEECSDNAPSRNRRSITATDARNFLLVAESWVKHRTFVPAEEAERRASICAACPMNVPITGCIGCTSLVALATKVIGGRTTSQDAKLEGCAVCGCALKASVHIPKEDQLKGVTPAMVFPENCWKKP